MEKESISKSKLNDLDYTSPYKHLSIYLTLSNTNTEATHVKTMNSIIKNRVHRESVGSATLG